MAALRTIARRREQYIVSGSKPLLPMGTMETISFWP